MNLVVSLLVKGLHIPSFKNHKHSNRNGSVYTDPRVKRLMTQLESGMLSGLYSASQTGENVTGSECLKQLRTALSGLSDDSIREIPECSFVTEYVAKGEEGVELKIYKL
jgi:hypothetical protein